MVITYQKLPKIQFPVYKLPSSNWSWADGLLFLENSIVDDTNMPAETLGLRRLLTSHKELLPLKYASYDLRGILKSRTPYFIDTKGTPFIYQKTKTCKLSYYKIKKIDKKVTASILWLEGVNSGFTVLRPPVEEIRYVGVLHLGASPWMLYEYSVEFKRPTRRKV